MRNIEEIYQELLVSFSERVGFVPEEGCDLAVRLWAAAAQIQGLEYQADWVLDQSFPQTARGIYLDRHGMMRGISRTPAAKAVGTLRFSVEMVPAADMTIPAGTVCILTACPTAVTTCTNPAAFSGGSDAETDEAFRERILESYRRLPNGANAAWYEQTAMNYPGTAAARAVGRARGIGTVDVYVAAENGLPPAELLEGLQAVLQEKREIAVDVQVKAPAVRTVDVQVEIALKNGADYADMKRAVEGCAAQFFTGRLLGQPVLLAELGSRIYALEGVENYHLLAPTEDLAADDTVLPVLGTLTVTEMEA